MSRTVSVGIDLGTTFSAVAWINPRTGRPEIIPNRDGDRLTPSAIQFDDGDIYIGREAADAFAAGEEGCAVSFKRQMGEDGPLLDNDGEPYVFDGRTYTPVELSAMLLRRLKEDAETALSREFKDDVAIEAVITVPAYFESAENEATLQAAQQAGIRLKQWQQLLQEPLAAAYAHGTDHWRGNANILVYDLGGGTFDTTLVFMQDTGDGPTLQTIVTNGNHRLGGRDWDNRLTDLLVSHVEQETGTTITPGGEAYLTIKGMSEDVKKRLSQSPAANVSIQLPRQGRVSVTVTRDEFTLITADLLEQTGALCRDVLAEAGLSVRDVTDVLLIGGSTKMPQVTDYLTRMFGKPPLKNTNPDEAVAIGAAIYSNAIN